MLSKYSISSLNKKTLSLSAPHYSVLSPLPPTFIITPTKCSMKFWKKLKQHIQQSLPGWRDKYLAYKDLKKLVNLISAHPAAGSAWKAEAEFVYLLNSEIDKFNAFFMEQEEDFIIWHKELQQRIQRVINEWGLNGSHPCDITYREEMGKIRKDMVDLHGELVLLENYSNINYTGLAKILKKYDKRTGGLLRLPFIQKVLEEPFFTTDVVVSKLIKECESTIDELFPAARKEEEEGGGDHEKAVMAMAGEGIFKNTVAALFTMQEIRGGSSTYGHHSLPPLNFPDSDLIRSIQLQFPISIV